MASTKVPPTPLAPQTGAAKKKAAKAARQLAHVLPITHHDVTCALTKAEAALDLLKLAEEHYEGGSLEWMRGICINLIGETIDAAKVAYVKAVGDKTATATEAAR